ncbi:alanine racemase [Pseudonocardia spinosispora]|uniref:alanine racemase n=1 Tax=Pseudonocardia spinosispora TaxID=103441 RepID=UPI000684C4FD|nr:alanine racemase [Pseudonocardia spinosispora]
MDTAFALPTLPARQAGWVRDVLADPELLADLAHGVGGPYHLLYPPEFEANVDRFRSVLDAAGVPGRVFYAKKANKAEAWARSSAELGIGVDVASAQEIRAALGQGVRGADLVVTGPAKPAETLRLAARQNCLLAVDSLDELDRVRALPEVPRVLLRCLPSASDSRFGLTEDELDTALLRCRDSSVRLVGFSFHLSGYEPTPRADLAAVLVRHCQRAREVGLPADLVSIGGGFAVDYVTEADWRRFRADDRPERYHAGRTFDGFYPYHSPVAGADMLAAVLDTVPAGEQRTLASLLRAANVTLALEPGRALLDQAGVTVFTIQGVKDRGHGILTVDGTSLSLSEQWFASEFLPDPIASPSRAGRAYPACVGGASCLESDMLTWRKVVFPGRPQVGDQLMYLNTAGYQMDSNESEFHELPLPPKIVLDRDGPRLRWRLDSPA